MTRESQTEFVLLRFASGWGERTWAVGCIGMFELGMGAWGKLHVERGGKAIACIFFIMRVVCVEILFLGCENDVDQKLSFALKMYFTDHPVIDIFVQKYKLCSKNIACAWLQKPVS